MKIIQNILIILFLILSKAYSFETNVEQAILMDYETGEILYSKNADYKAFPSSMAKIMTAYLIFEDLSNEKFKTTDTFQVSNDAWKQIGSRMFLNINSKVSIDELLKGLITQSGNDSAYTLAEGSTGSIDTFVKKMNKKAKELEMKNTSFTNPIGYSDEDNYMSAKDTAILSRNLIKKFPEYYLAYFSIPEYTFNKIKQQNRNLLLGKYDGLDGIKTGHTEAGGYSLSTSAFKNGRRLIAIVNGSKSENERTEESKRLLDYGFLSLNKYTLYSKNQIIQKEKVSYGKQEYVNIITPISIYATAQNKEDIIVEINIEKNLKAPIYKDQKLGDLTIKTKYDTKTYILYPEYEIKEVGFFKKILLKIYNFIKNIFI